MTERVDLYTSVTQTIIDQLARGVSDVERPWTGAASVRPIRANGEAYRGINTVVLWCAATERGYQQPRWMTFKQAQELGGAVRKGEKATRVCYVNAIEREEEGGEGGEPTTRKIPFLKAYPVFNVEQIDGLPATCFAPVGRGDGGPSPIPHATAFFDGLGLTIGEGHGRAFYRRDVDQVFMPPLSLFKDAEAYYAVLGHEVTHWTGHPSRLDRQFGQRFGDRAYAFEELVAEFGAAFLAADLGLYAAPRMDHAAYIHSWLDILKGDNRAIFTAASLAQAACDFIHAAAGRRCEVNERAILAA